MTRPVSADGGRAVVPGIGPRCRLAHAYALSVARRPARASVRRCGADCRTPGRPELAPAWHVDGDRSRRRVRVSHRAAAGAGHAARDRARCRARSVDVSSDPAARSSRGQARSASRPARPSARSRARCPEPLRDAEPMALQAPRAAHTAARCSCRGQRRATSRPVSRRHPAAARTCAHARRAGPASASTAAMTVCSAPALESSTRRAGPRRRTRRPRDRASAATVSSRSSVEIRGSMTGRNGAACDGERVLRVAVAKQRSSSCRHHCRRVCAMS